MADENQTTFTEDTEREDSHPLVGVPEGFVDDNNEQVVYEYDDEGNFLGWHKEAV